ncbi:MAG: 4Fe-4S binding protein [Gammaproteobacteria bacterium]|jgi:DMSO reductase family type II enzyme iron-sulfur subunit|nr:4Fe-4S binding protein [Gammaproteobacteria bacterium]
MALAPQGAAKEELRRHDRQIANIIDLNKCMGCQTCTQACKSLWTTRDGTEHMRWMNVTTFPGKGYPRGYETMGGGFGKDREPTAGALPNMSDSGDAFVFNHAEVYFGGKGNRVHLQPAALLTGEEPRWGYNWDEDEGAGTWPNGYYFYLPRKCYHCADPPCLEACAHNAIYKREQDGIVVIDQDRCHGDRLCVEACPYKAIYYNPVTEKGEKCMMCYPRIEQGVAPACDRQCPGRTRLFGYEDDKESDLYKLLHVHQVALPLHPEFGTGPNVFYVPPFESTKAFAEDGSITEVGRMEMSVLEALFGDGVSEVVAKLRTERAKRQRGEPSEIMDLLIGRNYWDRFRGFDGDPEDPAIEFRRFGN